MGKSTVTTLTAVLLIGLLGSAASHGAEPNLLGWWEFDGDGTDSSGNEHHGTLFEDAHFVPGYSGQALALDGDGDYFGATDYKGLMSSSPITVTAWVQTTGNGEIIYWGRSGGGRRVEFRVNGGRLRIENGRGNIQGDTTMNDGEWHHAAATIPVDAEISYPFVKVYLDGKDDSRIAVDPENHTFRLVEHDANDDVTIGQRAYNGDRWFPGLIDDVRIYEEILTEAGIRDIMQYGYRASAHSPSPANDGKYEESWASLEWAPGPLAESYRVYIGTDFEDVNAGVESVFAGNVEATSLIVGVANRPIPDGLTPNTTYYWRVEAVSDTHPDSPWRGDVWSFWIPAQSAYNPFPGDGEMFFDDPDVDLTWDWGLKAIYGTIYIGTDANEIANAAGGPPHMETVYDPGPLELGTTYYWRADTFNGVEWVQGPVWQFRTLPDIPVAADPNFIVWYQMDEGSGSGLLDWSGHGNHAELFEPQWSPSGMTGQTSLAFNGLDDYVAIKNLYYDDANNAEVTVAAWVRTTEPNQQVIVSFDRSEFYRLEINTELANAPVGPGRVGWHAMTNSGEFQVDTGSFLRIDDGQWHHLCGVFDNGELTTYIDGDPERSVFGGAMFGEEIVRYGYLGTGSEALTYNGTPRTPAGHFNGNMDDVRIYSRALSPEEILELTRGDLVQAWDFQPRTGRVFEVDTIRSVSWQPGDGAADHDVYFGTDAEAVGSTDASDATGVYKGRQGGTTFRPAGPLAWGQTYYWRIDEVDADGTVTKGRVLQFTVADYITIEDFEAYTDSIDDGTAIFDTWIDGWTTGETGSVVGNLEAPFAERRIVYDGGQAMPLDYNNVNPPWYSETERAWETAQNWTGGGVDTLTLYYTAGPLTDVTVQGLGTLYVGLEDSAGHLAVIAHPDPNAVRQIEWQQWDIPLAELSAAGVNPAAITKMYIGIGDRNQPVPDGAGRIYIDAIRLTKAVLAE